MGVYDREYLRGDSQGPGLFATSPVCKGLIAVNVAIFVLGHLGARTNPFDQQFGLNVSQVLHHGHVWQLLTYAFLHADVLHLAFNMYILWLFGRELEAMYGTRDFLVLYLTAAVVAGLAAVAWQSYQGLGLPIEGASGAVWALITVYATTYPRRELLFLFVIPIEVWLLVSILFGYEVFRLYFGEVQPIAREAHIAGAIYGYLFKQLDLRPSRLRRDWWRTRRPRLRIVTGEPRDKATTSRGASGPTWSTNVASSAKPATSAVLPEEQLDARLDELLAKIAQEGRGALSDEENRVLHEASLRIRNRRTDRP